MQMQTQRMILWIIFSMSLLFLWDAWQKHTGQPSMFGGPPPAQTTADGTGPAAGPAADASVPQAPASAGAGDGSGRSGAVVTGEAPGGVVGGGSGQTVRLANDVLALEIDAVGGQVRRAELLKHRDLHAEDHRNFVLLQDAPGHVYLAQSGLTGAAAGNEGFPTHRTPMNVVGEAGARTAEGGTPATLSLVGQSGGVKLERTYSLPAGSYVLEVSDRITNETQAPVQPTLYLQMLRDGDAPAGGSSFYSTYYGPVIYTDADKFQKVAFGNIEKGNAKHSTTARDGWAGIIEHYFISAWVPQQGTPREYYTRKVGDNLYTVGVLEPMGAIAPGASATSTARLLMGPQDQEMLAATAPGLDLAVDYGWLTVIAKPIHWLLDKLHSLVGNWGWAIVLLTIIIKTIFFPLQAASYKSMARMKAVTPRMQQIRERYGDDRVKMNQAMMELYKTEKINPLGGCLPILVQIPVFIALYYVLLASVEMRDAPWIGWITDLSSKDPYFILPALMAVSMFIQVKLNPTPPDPVQAKMMMIMPLAFSVMFFLFPAGLVLYWLVNNIYSIAQQWVITRKIEGEAAAKKARA